MAIKTLITSREFFNAHRNRTNFTANLADKTPNLVANVMDLIKVVFTVEVSVNDGASVTNPWDFDGNLIHRASGSWKDEGFSISDTLIVISGLIVNNIIIDNISDDGLTLVFSYETPGTPFPDGETESAGANLRFDLSPKPATTYFFGLVENNGNTNYNNLITQSVQAYYLNDANGTLKSMLQKGVTNRDWVTGETKINVIYGGVEAEYTIESTFIMPFYAEGDLANLQNNILPSYLVDDNSLKHVFQLDVASAVTNPNSAISIISDINKGSTGGYNENFNGFNNNYTVTGITYKDTLGNTIDGLQISARTNVTITVQANNRNFTNTVDRFGLYIAYLPSSEEYTNTETDFKQNFLYDIFTEATANVTFSGSDILKNINVTASGNVMTFNFDVEYSTAQQLKLDENSNYIIAISTEDPALTAGNSDRVTSIADIGTYQAQPVEGFVNIESFRFLKHNEVLDVDLGIESYGGWNEDGIIADVTFNIDTSKNVIINGVSALLVAHNESTGNFFELDSYQFDLSEQILVGSTQTFNINGQRNYILKSTDPFNIANLKTGSKVGDLQKYTLQLGQKISWQDWISNTEVDTVFYDDTKPNNNLNNKSSNYSALNGYKIKMATALNVTGINDLGKEVTGVETDYSGVIDVFDYDTVGTSPKWTLDSLEFIDSLGNSLGENLKTTEDLIMKATWSRVTVPVLGAIKYAIHRIEIANSQNTLEEMSSINEAPANQILRPLDGENFLKVELIDDKIVTQCLVKGSKLNPSSLYNFTVKIQE